MHVSRGKDVNLLPADSPIFRGDVRAHSHIDQKTGEQLRLNLVRFGPGGRTNWHTHEFEQGLIILEGKGIVATEEAEHVVEAGDVVIVPQMEKHCYSVPHWHGGTDTTSMTHISINQVGETTVVGRVEKIRTKEV